MSNNRKRWHIQIWTVFVFIFAVVNASGYDDSGGSSEALGTDIHDYASNNGQIPNHLVAEPVVSCAAESVSLDFQTTRPFGGRIFVKGKADLENMQG